MQDPTSSHGRLAIAFADVVDPQRRAERYDRDRDRRTPQPLDRRAAAVTAAITLVVAIGLLSLDPTSTATTRADSATESPIEEPAEVRVHTARSGRSSVPGDGEAADGR